MSEYISREAAIKEVYRFDGYLDDDLEWRLHYALKRLPAADVVERPRWIPVTERLPEEDCKVLAYYGFNHGDGYLGMMFMQVLDYYARDPRPHFQQEGLNGMTVTHWMPLPTAPETPKDGGQDYE